MKKLYIFCSAGMSSSLLADKMQKFANEKNLGVEVKFFPEEGGGGGGGNGLKKTGRERTLDC